MAKVKAPLFGFGASGQLGKSIVFGSWKGLDIAREYVIPANPNTSGQSTQRGYMTSMVGEWHDTTNALSAADKAAWGRLAGVQSTPRTGFNEFIKRGVDAMIGGSAAEHMFGIANIDLTAGAFIANIDDSASGVLVVTLHLGNTKTYFPVTNTDVQVAGLTSFAATATGFAAGTTVYYWFDVPAGATYKRSGLYTGVLI